MISGSFDSAAMETHQWVPEGPSILRALPRFKGGRILFLATSLRIRLHSELSRAKFVIYGPVLHLELTHAHTHTHTHRYRHPPRHTTRERKKKLMQKTSDVFLLRKWKSSPVAVREGNSGTNLFLSVRTIWSTWTWNKNKKFRKLPLVLWWIFKR